MIDPMRDAYGRIIYALERNEFIPASDLPKEVLLHIIENEPKMVASHLSPSVVARTIARWRVALTKEDRVNHVDGIRMQLLEKGFDRSDPMHLGAQIAKMKATMPEKLFLLGLTALLRNFDADQESEMMLHFEDSLSRFNRIGNVEYQTEEPRG